MAAPKPKSTPFKVVPLVADTDGVAPNTDASLVNPWGISFSPTGPFWVSDNHTGVSTLYNGTGAKQALTVTIPAANQGDTGSPTGQVFNGNANAFHGDHFIFANEDGTIAGWPGGTSAATRATTSGAVYKGLAMLSNGTSSFLLAANFHQNRVDAFDQNYAPVQLAPKANFTDPKEPAGYAPFNIAVLNGSVYVSYAKQDADAHDDDHGPGRGFVDMYTTTGKFVKRLITGTAVRGTRAEMNSPWGMAIAPSGFGKFQGQLLVGNFGSGQIGVYNAKSGKFAGLLSDTQNHPLAIDGLWALVVGGGTANNGDAHKVYFSAGPQGESHGLLGDVEPAS